MAYDSARGVTILFGGQEGFLGPDSDETWEWDGNTWTQRITSGPTAREDHAMAFDSARQVVVLFGGWHHGFDGETWEWDGFGEAAWTNYGTGWPGTNGIPSFTAATDPRLCTIIDVDLANSRGVDTIALLLIGARPCDVPTDYGGHVLVVPVVSSTLTFTIPVPAAGLTKPFSLPCSSTLCGHSIYLQALEVDPGASQGFSFTRGLRLLLGL
jgi:hypothetical protein